MHNAGHAAPKEKSNPFFFIPVVLLASYLIFTVVTFAFNYGAEKGSVKATYMGPVEEDTDEAAQVFDHKRLIKPTDELVDLGSRVYRNNCASCHGAEGYGNGPSGAGLAVKPRNFHGDPSEWKNGASIITMYETLENGLGSMPNFPALNPEQRYAVIHYIHRDYMEGDYPADSEEAIAALPEPSAGGGGVDINPYTETRIPVRYAIDKMLENKN